MASHTLGEPTPWLDAIRLGDPEPDPRLGELFLALETPRFLARPLDLDLDLGRRLLPVLFRPLLLVLRDLRDLLRLLLALPLRLLRFLDLPFVLVFLPLRPGFDLATRFLVFEPHKPMMLDLVFFPVLVRDLLRTVLRRFGATLRVLDLFF